MAMTASQLDCKVQILARVNQKQRHRLYPMKSAVMGKSTNVTHPFLESSIEAKLGWLHDTGQPIMASGYDNKLSFGA